MLLELLWWIGLAWFAAWVAVPLLVIPLLGLFPGLVAWAVLAPWSALLGMVAIHRLLPVAGPGTFRLFADRGALNWALKGWAPSLYLTVFQPVFFMSEGFQRIALRAFGARMGRGALLTSRTIIREPHQVRVGAGTLVGEYVHLACSYQPRPKLLVVGTVDIGERVLIGAYSHIAPGARIGDECLLEYGVRVGAGSAIGVGTKVGAETSIYNGVRIGDGVTIGKCCVILSGADIPDAARIPDGTVVGRIA